MFAIEVLGSGCSKCRQTADRIAEIARALGVDVQLEKVSDPQTILRYGVMQTPAVVIDQRLVHSGSVPEIDTIKQWLGSPAA